MALGGGTFTLWFSDRLAMAIPYRRTIGMGAIAFGLLGVLAFALRGRNIAFRIQSLLVFCVCAGITVLAGYSLLTEGWKVRTGVLTVVFGLFALLKLRDLLRGRRG